MDHIIWSYMYLRIHKWLLVIYDLTIQAYEYGI